MPYRKRHDRRPRSSTRTKKHPRPGKAFCEKPRVDPRLKPIFQEIGVPKPTPFRPDPFQLEALEGIRECDVLVSAPTGSGKTWIATQAISRGLSQGLRTWYASPLKALSNAIYQEFCSEFGPGACGILTGDRKENPGAPIIVGTTEILRNQLYDAMQEGASIPTDLVVLDEAHYLSDPDRGVVWEEVLIYLPARVRLLLLSATISNAEEIAAWLEEIRRTKAHVVRSHERPVPLEMLFLFPDGLITPLCGKKGLAPRVKKFTASAAGRGRRRGSENRHFGDIIRCLKTFDLLPAIFFLKSRLDCDRALLTCHEDEENSKADKESLNKEVRDFLGRFPHLERQRQLKTLLKYRVGAHHAGQLPYWKMLIEKTMVKGYLDAIFSTSTVAAGVNFPARTVVLVQSDRYDGRGFSNLTATELHQMTGRAGRRGKDNVGFAVLIPGLHQDPELIYDLKDSPPEPLVSQIRINFSMTLNLLLSHRPEEVQDLLDFSFASFQERGRGSGNERHWEDRMNALREMLPRARCDSNDPYEVLENIQKRAELRKKTRRRRRDLQEEALVRAYAEYLRPGRLILHKNRNVYVVFHTTMEKGRLVCGAHNLRRTLGVRKGRIRLRKLDIHQIKAILDYRVDMPEDYSVEDLEGLFAAIPRQDMAPLDIPIPDVREAGKGVESPDEEWAESSWPCEGCDHLKRCHGGKKGALGHLLRDFRAQTAQMESLPGGLWLSFKRHLRFLKDTGFVDRENTLTQDGQWASKLRLDHPLLIADAIRKGGFEGASPAVMAGCLAPFVWDRVQDVVLSTHSPLNLEKLEGAFQGMLDRIEGIRREKVKRGFENPQILFWPGAALYLWARGVSWDELRHFIPVDEGDMASLVVRTADHLRQVTNLVDSHPVLAKTAERAITLILREPVFIE
jgi:superfamily II RNA helicase